MAGTFISTVFPWVKKGFILFKCTFIMFKALKSIYRYRTTYKRSGFQQFEIFLFMAMIVMDLILIMYEFVY